MSTVAPPSRDAAASASFAFLQNLLKGYGPRDFAIRAWDGSLLEAEAPAKFTLVLQHPGAIRRMFWPPNNYSTGEAYIYDDFDIHGDIHSFFRLANHLRELRLSLWQKLKMAKSLFSLPKSEKPR